MRITAEQGRNTINKGFRGSFEEEFAAREEAVEAPQEKKQTIQADHNR